MDDVDFQYKNTHISIYSLLFFNTIFCFRLCHKSSISVYQIRWSIFFSSPINSRCMQWDWWKMHILLNNLFTIKRVLFFGWYLCQSMKLLWIKLPISYTCWTSHYIYWHESKEFKSIFIPLSPMQSNAILSQKCKVKSSSQYWFIQLKSQYWIF